MLYNSEEREHFLKNMNAKAKRKQVTHLTKSKVICATKDTLNKVKIQVTNREKIPETYKTQK